MNNTVEDHLKKYDFYIFFFGLDIQTWACRVSRWEWKIDVENGSTISDHITKGISSTPLNGQVIYLSKEEDTFPEWITIGERRLVWCNVP